MKMKTSHYRSNVNEELGKLGEENVYKALNGIDAKFLFNLYVPYNNSTSEIDLVVICPHNIYVIESKNYRGFIYGKEEDEYWVQKVGNRNKTNCNTFYNPIKQNDVHIKALEQFINEPMLNIVVFSNISKINIKSSSIVVQTRDIKNTITQIEQSSKNTINIEDVYNILKNFQTQCEEIKEEHIQNLTNNNFCNII